MLPMSIYVIHVLTRKNRRDTIISEDSGKSIGVKSKVPSLVLRVAACVRLRLEITLSIFALIRAYCFVS